MAKKMTSPSQGCSFIIVFYLVLAAFGLSVHAPLAHAGTVQLNCADRSWYPFVFMEKEHIRGIFIDIVEQAFENLNIPSRITAVPYKRAIKNCLKGKADGVIGIGFSSDLSTKLEFPPDADTGQSSKWHIARVEHVVVSSAKDDFDYSGDALSLPTPIRLRQGSRLLPELQASGVVIQELRDDIQGIRQLSRDGTGVVITTSAYAERIVSDIEFRDKIQIHGAPLASHFYYLAFANNSILTRQQKSSIWEEISRLRADYIFIMQVYSRY